jgi:hypothetical protein
MNISKPHPNVQIYTTVNINLSAKQWCLRTDDFSRVVIEKVADHLNKRVTRDFNQGENYVDLGTRFNYLKNSFEAYITPETDDTFKSITEAIYKMPVTKESGYEV